MLWETLSTARDLGRLQDITSVLIRYGFGDVVQRLGMGKALERAGRLLHRRGIEELPRLSTPERITRALQELGPTFIKLGQLLATRVDLFPPDWIAEFERLQDQVPPQPLDELRAQLEEDLGAPVEALFPYLDKTPTAAASLAQVHRAQLEDGTEVILKVRRPGIRQTVEADLRLLGRLAEIAEREVPDLRRYRPREVVRQLALSMRRELDFSTECHNAERIAANFTGDENIIVPKVYWQWTCERLNVQEYIDGIPGRDLKAVEAAGLDRKVLAVRGAHAVLKMILEDRFYHADPHPGNLFYLPHNRLAMIDFGMVGRLSESRCDQVAELMYGLLERRTDQVVEVLFDWAGEAAVDAESMHTDVENLLDRYHGLPLRHLNFAAMLTDLTALLRDHHLVLPSDLTLLFKAFISLDGLGRTLDPDFEIVAEAAPFLRRIMLSRYAPDALARRSWHGVTDIMKILADLPRDLRRLVKIARRGALQINVDMSRLDHFGQQMDRAASRLTVGLVTAALIVGSSIVATVGGGAGGVPALGVLGFIAAGFGGIWLLASIWRGPRA